MAHVELSLSEAFATSGRVRPRHPQPVDSFDRWATTVAAADEPCLVIDSDYTDRFGVSPSCCALLGLGEPTQAAGLPLLDAGLRLIDFTAAGAS